MPALFEHEESKTTKPKGMGERASEAREGKEWLLHDGNFAMEGMNRANLNQVFVGDVGNFAVVGEECEPRTLAGYLKVYFWRLCP